MDIKKFRKKIDKIMAGWSEAYKQAAVAVISRLHELLAAGYEVNQAVDMALKESAFFTAIDDKLKDALLQAAAVGFGIDPAIISAPAKAIIIEKLNTLPWAPDNMPLSTRLHGAEMAMRQAIAETIERQLRNGTNWVKLARQLYDGYGYGQVINRATLPKYLDELQRAARRTLAIDVNNPDRGAMAEYGRLIRQARRQIERLAQDGAPNKALKTSYKMLLDTAQDYSEKALDKAIEVAVNERSRYFAERISRTEIARAWADGFYARHQDDPDVIAYRWRLSSRHPKYDICDFHAKANLYGLGPGVYPKNSLPPQPAHPHCLCHWEEVFDGELGSMRQRDQVQKGGDEFLRKIDPADRRRLLGFDGDISWLNGGDWRHHLRQWKGHEDPRPRLTKTDFGLQRFRDIPPFSKEKVKIPTSKILNYCLDKNHKVGGPKAVAFEKVLGYNKDNYQELIYAIQENISKYSPVYKGDTQHGQKFEIQMELTGPSGRTANVLTAWIVDWGSDEPRLTSAYITERKVKDK